MTYRDDFRDKISYAALFLALASMAVSISYPLLLRLAVMQADTRLQAIEQRIEDLQRGR